MQIESCLHQAHVMQLATVADGQPWVCTVYFVADAQQSIYWLSFPSRRHSKELSVNARAAVTMAIKTDKPVVGLSAEGMVSIVEDATVIESVMRDYVAKYGDGQKFHENFIKSSNQHVMYKLTPSKYTLFDELNFPPEQARQEFIVE